MGLVNLRNSQTSRGWVSISPWTDKQYNNSVLQLNLGSNFISSLEIVSALNSFNLAHCEYHYCYSNCTEKYNPKVYLGAVQTAGLNWNYDYQKDQTNPLPRLPQEGEKSGSWPV